MDLMKLHDRALEAATTLVANVERDQLGLPTPCAEFDVQALLNHMIGGNHHFVAIAQGEPGDSVPATGDFVQDPLTPYRASAEAVSNAWNDPALMDRTVHLPFGDFAGRVALGIHTVEVVVHSWDLAKATGQPTELDPDLYDVAWEHSKDIDESLRGPGRPFGPAVTVATSTDTGRLMAWLGRQP